MAKPKPPGKTHRQLDSPTPDAAHLPSEDWLRLDAAGDVWVRIQVQPNARGESGFSGWAEGIPRLRLAAVPVDGKANRALCEFFATLCGMPKTAVRIERGAQTRIKQLRICAGSTKALEILRESSLRYEPK